VLPAASWLVSAAIEQTASDWVGAKVYAQQAEDF
jgi:hypothetical protein